MNNSYKRYWEPSTAQLLTTSLSVGAAATALCQPIEFLKIRIQTRSDGIGIRQKGMQGGYNPHKLFREIHATGGGMTQMFKGLDAAILARTQYLFVRNFIYKVIYDRVKPVKVTNDLSSYEKAWLGSFAGGIAAFLSNPWELIMVRQVYDGTLKPSLRRNYKSALDAASKISLEEGGQAALFKGALPLVLRSVMLNASLTIPFDWLNEYLWTLFGEINTNKPIALLYSSLVATCLTLPFDNVKTRLQKQFQNPAVDRITYKGLVDCVNQVIMNEGFTGFLAGFYTYYARVTLYGFLTVYTMDYINTRSKRRAGLDPVYM